jgi:predicted nucleic acid-binding protein
MSYYAELREGNRAAEKYSRSLGSRSLDLMHVAAAILLGAETFLSFDGRQKQVAEAEGLLVRP